MLRYLILFAVLTATACAPSLNQLRPTLDANESGDIRFATDEGDVLSGTLTFPSGSGPFPAVILMHGCGGLPSRAIEGWDPLLQSWGYATFVVDSFRGRNLREVCTDALALTGNQRIPDAYGALKILATHPRIDRARIALMGFSHGGIVTLAAATEWARRTYAAGDRTAFRVFLAFYPYCNAVVPELARRLAAPVRIHIGELDDWTPARTCESLASLARERGSDVGVTVYGGAVHSFDSVGLPVQRRPNVDNAADCTPRLASMRGAILNLDELKQCMRKGATVGWSPGATEQARGNVRAQLAEFVK
jgi:dienelactone hydrolase